MVKRLLKNPNWSGAAEAAIDYFVDGTECPIPSWIRSSTWTQVEVAYRQITKSGSPKKSTGESVGSAELRQQLLGDPSVTRLLNNAGWKPTAQAAVDYCVDGTPVTSGINPKSQTFRQVQEAYEKLKKRLR
ncbi:MAG TPA: hypothetical protein VGN17_06585 [Bryobacteraceae bacterium]|jgi:hypothetical protein